MATALYTPVTWAGGASLSSFVLFKAGGPSGLLIPAGMEGARMAFVRAPFVAGAVDPLNAVDVYDVTGTKATFVISATSRAIAFYPLALAGLGYLGLRTEDGVGAAVAQSGAVTAYWLGTVPAPLS